MKEIVIIMGLSWSGKNQYALEEFPKHQFVYPYAVKKAMEYMKLSNEKETLYLISEIMVRSFMISSLPIVVMETMTEAEAIFIWKKIAVEHDYELKVLLFDVPLEECFSNSDKRDKQTLKYLSGKSKKFEQLKQILNMEYQTIVDKVEVIKPSMEEDKDEVL